MVFGFWNLTFESQPSNKNIYYLRIKGGAKASGRALFQGAAARDSRVDFYSHTLRIYSVISVPARFIMISRQAVCMISWALVCN